MCVCVRIEYRFVRQRYCVRTQTTTATTTWGHVMRTQEELRRLTLEVLGEDYIEYSVSKYTLSEDIDARTARIVCQLSQVGKGPLFAVEGKGVGFIDALFNGLKSGLVNEYPSLGHIHFVDFVVSGNFPKTSDINSSHSDAPNTVRLIIENTTGREFTFENKSPSISGSSVAAVVKGIEHFVNAELAVLKVYTWIEDAQRRSRPDLVEKYTGTLAELVENATYSEAIERAQASHKGLMHA
ncbi:MAG: hypothetical protein UV42_C0031G0002 [Candidatus Magasanikbacteria bacterium GW2011_GWE2_42_7]|uniref:Uncharacterized protein n=1 Tax=Candidatus Magasanikbacteria bacterium GW2011_GWE2_42_7 TaxID=1619052 RepID=A0A0G1E9U4_9BACT|nr:MAG: hypothetical protein UV42_C0031G0002 [Candidatus Magasanikbacteria bacterium GW2011_GWE2_42_7]